MTFKEYQQQSRTTAMYPDIGKSFVYPVLGLSGEAAEIANKVKKIFRDQGGVVTDETKKNIKKELGDVLWYVAQVATEFQLDLDKVAKENLDKLFSRKERGTITGSGDNR